MKDRGGWEDRDVCDSSFFDIDGVSYWTTFNDVTKSMNFQMSKRGVILSVQEVHYAQKKKLKMLAALGPRAAREKAVHDLEAESLAPVGTGAISFSFEVPLEKMCSVTVPNRVEYVMYLHVDPIEKVVTQTSFHPDDIRVQVPEGEAPKPLEFDSTADYPAERSCSPSRKRKWGDQDSEDATDR